MEKIRSRIPYHGYAKANPHSNGYFVIWLSMILCYLNGYHVGNMSLFVFSELGIERSIFSSRVFNARYF